MTNHSKVGGVLALVSGGIGILVMLLFILMALFIASMPGMMVFQDDSGRIATEDFFFGVATFYGVMALIGILLGVLAIVGGSFALKKKYWGWALAGAICGTLVFFPCGIPAIIFVSIGKAEFQPDAPPLPPLATGG